MYEINLSKYLRPARLIRIVLGERYGEATVSFTSGGGNVNMHNLKREIYNHLEAAGWERFKITTVRATETGMIVNLKREKLKHEAEAWSMFLGGVITNPPEA